MNKWKGKTLLQIIPDENLAKIIGIEPTTTPDMVRKLWIYIRKNCTMKKIKV